MIFDISDSWLHLGEKEEQSIPQHCPSNERISFYTETLTDSNRSNDSDERYDQVHSEKVYLPGSVWYKMAC